MPIRLSKPLNDEEAKIFLRFKADIDRLANDMEAQVNIIKIGREGDIPYVMAEIERAFDENKSRVDLFADSLTWQGFQLGSAQGIFDQQDIIVWNLDPEVEKHCDTCYEYAAIKYFTQDSLPGIPGVAPTICDGGCRCYLTSE
jgi:hypothetical protein